MGSEFFIEEWGETELRVRRDMGILQYFFPIERLIEMDRILGRKHVDEAFPPSNAVERLPNRPPILRPQAFVLFKIDT